jgi:hypothetical protein
MFLAHLSDLSEWMSQVASTAIKPNGVHFKANAAAKFNAPAGISVDVWDCFNASQATGPVVLPQVCESSFRKIVSSVSIDETASSNLANASG